MQANLEKLSKNQNGEGYKRYRKSNLKLNKQPKKFKFRRLIDVFDNE